MRKIFFLGLCVLAALASCKDDKDEPVVVPPSNPSIEKVTVDGGELSEGIIRTTVGTEALSVKVSALHATGFKWTMDGVVDDKAMDDSVYTFKDAAYSGNHTLSVSVSGAEGTTPVDTAFQIKVEGKYAGKLLVIGGDGVVSVMNGNYEMEEKDLSVKGLGSQMQFASLEGDDLYTVNGGDDLSVPLMILDPQTLDVKLRADISKEDGSVGTLYTATKANDAKAYINCAVSAKNGGVIAIDLKSGKSAGSKEIPGNIPEKLQVLPDGKVLGATSTQLYTIDPATNHVEYLPLTFPEKRSIVGYVCGKGNDVYVALGAEAESTGYDASPVEGSHAQIIHLDASSWKTVGNPIDLAGVLLNTYVGSYGYTDGSSMIYSDGEKPALVFYGKTSFEWGGTANIYRLDLTTNGLTTIETGTGLASACRLSLGSDGKTVFFSMMAGPYSYSYNIYAFDFDNPTASPVTILKQGYSAQSAGTVIDLRD